MTIGRVITIGAALMVWAPTLHAQTTSTTRTPGNATYSAERLTGEVVNVDGNLLLAKMVPGGYYRLFDVQPGRVFMIDGMPKSIAQLEKGTMLTAVVLTTTKPVTVRTTTITNGTVWYASGKLLIVTLPNGENREYTVPDGFKFDVEGRKTGIDELRKGMKVSGSKVVEEPQTEISTQTQVTGTAPKK
jgi:hypothetical protein